MSEVVSQPTGADSVRAQQREEWRGAAPGWVHLRREVSTPTKPITERLIEMAGIHAGQRVLDIACGTGDPAFTIADRVGPHGSVLGLDITPEMVEGAHEWAQQHGIRNTQFRLIQSELELGVPDESFNAATCRHGLMYMPDPREALQAVRQALKPGGRAAVSTWGPLDHFPYFAMALQVISRHLELPPPDPTAPGPMALPTAEALRRVFVAAGFADVRVVAFDVAVSEADTPAAFWDILAETAGPLVPLLASLPETQRQAIRDDAVGTLGAIFPRGPVRMGGEALVAAGVK